MPSISDIIESFLLELLTDSESLQISRNELANHFSVSPSQINYVLSTRFNFDKGFVMNSKRGGGGGITIVKIDNAKDYLVNLANEIQSCSALKENRVFQMIVGIVNVGLISVESGEILKVSVSNKALNSYLNIADSMRKSIMFEVIKSLVG